MRRAWELISPFVRWMLLAVVVLGVLFLLTSLFGVRPPDEFKIATGRQGGAYYAFAEQYQARFAEEGVTVNIRETAGSLETLDLLNSGEVDVGFVQNTALYGHASPDLSTLASLYYEPVWIFYSDELPTLLRDARSLAGLRISVGEEGSATQSSSMAILNGNGVTAENSTILTSPSSEAKEQLKAGEIDVMMYIAGASAPLVNEMLHTPGIRLMSFDRAEAYERIYKTATKVTLPEGVIDLAQGIPTQEVDLIAARATLVANKKLHPDLARLLLIVATEVHGRGGILEEPGEFPSADFVTIPMNADAMRYLENGPTGLERYLPLWLASRLERWLFLLLPIVLILYPLLRGAPQVPAYINRYRITRRYQRLREIEQYYKLYDASEVDAAIADLENFQEELNEKVNVPTSMLDALYELRMHTKLTLDSLYARQQALEAAGQAASS